MYPPNTKTLVVDDMLTMRKIVTKCLRDLGFTDITEAADGVLAWAEVEKARAAGTPIQLIISDWNMPNMTGIDFLRKVRADASLKGLPFLLLTAESEKTQVIEAIQAGVSGYVVKPFTPANLAEKLKAAYAAKK